jgi:hypothetical protein
MGPARTGGYGIMSKRFLAGAIAGVSMLAAGVPAAAAPSCWGEREVSAAHVRQMQTMLMVAALRCRAAGIDISTDYDGFVTAERDALGTENGVIKQHFAQAGGTQSDYDRFATSLANGFGDDETSQASCADAAALAHEGAAALSAVALEKVAAVHLFPAALPGGVCNAPAEPVIAAATPVAPKAEAPAPIIMAAAPIAEPQPVSLPSDLVAALTVLARFHAAPATQASEAPTQVAGLVR